MALNAIRDGYFKSLDEKASETLSEWKGDPLKSKITIRDLLTLTSGIDGGEAGQWPTYQASTEIAASRPVGARFSYGPAPFLIFGEMLRRKLPEGKSVDGYLAEKVLQPLGISVRWAPTRDGNPALPGGARMTARDWANYGQLVLQGGIWKGKTLIPNLESCFKPTRVNPAYGLTWWLSPNAEATLVGRRVATDPDLRMAAGLGKQRLYVVPSRKLVVVRMGSTRGGAGWRDDAFLKALTGD